MDETYHLCMCSKPVLGEIDADRHEVSCRTCNGLIGSLDDMVVCLQLKKQWETAKKGKRHV